MPQSRSSTKLLIAWQLLCLTLALFATASRAVAQDDGKQELENVDDAPEAILSDLRAAQLDGDFSFSFTLENRPHDRSKDARTYWGQMAGAWRNGDTLYRFEIIEDLQQAGDPIHAYALQLLAGKQPHAWKCPILIARADFGNQSKWQRGPIEAITGDALFQPVVPDLVYTPFELQMPFIYWEQWSYVGRDRTKGRGVHVFDMLPPPDIAKAQPELSAVRLYIDHKFAALLKAEILGSDGKPMRTFKINKIKKVQGRYIVREIDLFDEKTRDKTRFTVNAAATGLALPYSIFEPGDLLNPPPAIPADQFELLD